MLGPTASYVTEKAKGNYMVKFLKKIVFFYFCNKKHLLRCQIYINELPKMCQLVVLEVRQLSTGWSREAHDRMTKPGHL